MVAVFSVIGSIASSIVSFFVVLGSFFSGPSAPVPLPLVQTYAPIPGPVDAELATTSAVLPSVAQVQPTRSARPVASTTSAINIPTATTSIAAPTPTALSTDQLNVIARASLVNILCTTASGGSFNPISGSGVIIDSRGIILTNAHVAQYFLLRDYPTKDNVQCVVRMGSPAQPRYTAELMYLPPSWITANAQKISSSTPSGTGENDYALLRIVGTTNPNGTLPSVFPALPMDASNPSEGDTMLLAAYPAGFLGGISITLNLYQTSAVSSVGQLYAFSGENVDLFSLGGSIVSQAGSSGGAAVNGRGKLQGIIVTEIPAATTAARDLRALSIGHVNRSLMSEGMGGLVSLLLKDPAAVEADFNASVAPGEIQALTSALKQ